MAVVNLIPDSGETRTRETHPILVRITPTVQRDYLRRRVFPHLRTCNAAQMNGATAVFFITEAEAVAILNDAAAQRLVGEAPRGTSKAYTALSASLAAQVDQERNRGLIPDPGYEVARVRDAEGWSQFKVGDVAVFYSEFVDNKNDGQTVSITAGYSFGRVVSERGQYIKNDGSRFAYRWGYIAKFLTGDSVGEQYFFAAHNLRSPRSEVTHLRLVE